MTKQLKIVFLLCLATAVNVSAGTFTLISNEFSDGSFMTKKNEYNNFGCLGGNSSPHLEWYNSPKGTKSFAITTHDADAPTGSGWWHWQVINIPDHIQELKSGAGVIDSKLMPEGAVQIKNDYGSHSFGGACPPKGHGIHHYKFTVHALSISKLELPEDPSSALVGYIINTHTIESSTIKLLYKRD